MIHEAIFENYSSNQGAFSHSLTSETFTTRVMQGVNRLRKLRAESSFHILANKQEVLFTKLRLGTTTLSMAGDEQTGYVGLDEFGSVKSLPDLDNLETKLFYSEDRFKLIGDFHFHPNYSPFSNEDIQGFDSNISWNTKKDSFYDIHINMLCGVFMPRFNWNNKAKKWQLPLIDLLMFAGPSETNDYQGYDFDKLSLDEQKTILADSGFKVSHLSFPIIRQEIDLESLKQALL